MKLAIVSPVYPPYRGGMGAVAAADAARARAKGLDVAVFTPDYGQIEKSAEATYLKPLLAVGNAAVLPSLLWQLWKFDLVHLHYTFYGADVFVWLWSILSRKPYILTYHMQPKTTDWRELIFRLHRLVLEPVILRRAAAVLVSSFDYAKSLGLKHANLIELPFGVDTERFHLGRDDEYRVQLGLPMAATVFVFVGGLDKAHSFKGIDVLIRAAATLPTNTDWRVLIVGEGDMKPAYLELAKTLGLAERIMFAGAVSDADLPRAYRAADVHILPSVTKSEAFGLVTLEAAASGLPSIVSDLPGVRTLVKPESTGVVVEPGSEESLEAAMLRFVLDPSLSEIMGAAARARVENEYSNAVLANRLLEVYKGVTV